MYYILNVKILFKLLIILKMLKDKMGRIEMLVFNKGIKTL